MVFESVVTDVLNKILGDYVENLDSKQLRIGIWGGDVVLHNLKLRDNALDEIDLPLQLVYGYLGKLVLKIPWKNLYSQPVVAQIEDFYLLISPKQSVQFDEEKERKYDFQTKQTALQALEDAQKKELAKDQIRPDAGFAEKLTAQIVNNLQAKISNVHIRYEDTTTADKPFAFGVTLHDLELYTTDCNWVKCYLTEQVSRVYKIAKLDSLAVYMNCTSWLFSEFEKDELSNMCRQSIARKDYHPDGYNYIAGPLSSTAKLQLNMNPEYDSPPFEIPKIDLCLELEKLSVGVTSTQFQYVLKLADSLNRSKLGAPYRKYRPYNTPYKKNAKVWWRFAITAVLEEEIRKKYRAWTWEHISQHRELCRTYAEKYKEKESTKKPPQTLVEACTLLEQRLDLFNLLLVRQRVKIDVEKIKKEEELKTSQKGGWFSGWFGGGKKAEDDEPTDIVKKLEAAMTPEERLKLNQAIGYEENVVPLDLPETYHALNMNFKLEALEIGLYDDRKEQEEGPGSTVDISTLQTIILLRLSMATCGIKQRPAASAISVTAGVKEMVLTGLEKSDFTPTIIASKITDEFNLIDVFFETNPLDKQCDQRIKVFARPLQIVYDSDTILHLIKVFSPPRTVNLSELSETASEKMSNFKERTATGMQYMIEQHAFIEVDITFMPNILIIPSTGTYYGSQNSLIVVSLGQFQISSQPQKQRSLDVGSIFDSGKERHEILKNVFEQVYDKFNISIDDMQLLVVRPRESWEEILHMATVSEMHVLRPTSLKMTAHLCVLGDDPRLPKTKVDFLLPSIHFNFTEERILEAVKLLTSLPLPESDEHLEAAPIIKAVSLASKKSLSRILYLDLKKPKAEKSAPELPLDTEIIQYTNLEMTFTLKEFNVTLYKSNVSEISFEESPIDSTSYSTPVEDMPNSIQTFEDDDVQPTRRIQQSLVGGHKLLSLQILQLEAYVAQRTYELVATAKLGAINLTNYDISLPNEKQIAIIETPRFSEELKYLLTISYTMADKSSPEFSTKYNSTEQLIVVNFSTLNIILHQECLQHLMEIADALQRKLDFGSKQPATPKDRVAFAGGDNIVNKMATILEEDAEIVAAVAPFEKRKARSTKVVNSIKIHVLANLEQVGLLLTCHKRPLASMRVEHFNAGVTLKSSYTELKLSLRDIIVTDLNPKSIHTSILSIVGDNALNCQIVLFNLDETADYNSDDMKITVEIGCMKIVFLNWFVTSVLNFLNKFQAAQQAIANAGAAAADAAKQNALDAYEKATRMKLNIKIKAPIILVPIHSQSTSGIALDLGQLALTNTTAELNVPGNEHSPAVLDDIRLELKDMKISKVTILQESTGSRDDISIVNVTDYTDAIYGMKSKVNIMDPISFILTVKRNLSSSWYKDLPEMDVSGRLKSIELNLFMEDYALIMSILNRNLSEGADEFPSVEPPPPSATVASDLYTRKTSTDLHSGSQSPAQRQDSQNTPQRLARQDSSPTRRHSRKLGDHKTHEAQKVYEQLKFNFQFDGVVANLMLNETEGLSRFGIYFLSVKGSKLIDGTLSTSVVLCNIQIDDTRPFNKSKITKYLCRKDWKEKAPSAAQFDQFDRAVDACYEDRNYMLDVIAIIKENDTFAEVRVCGFDLILCIDYLLKLADFFQIPEEDQQITKTVNTPAVDLVSKSVMEVKSSVRPPSRPTTPPAAVEVEGATEKKMNLILHIEEPDIILIESLEDINTNAIIFNAQAKLNYRAIGEKQLINGEIDSLKMYMCSFMPEKRDSTKHYIIHPCVISLQGSTPDQAGLHISLKLSEIIINVSPATIELFNKAMLTINSSSNEKAAVQKGDSDYTNTWNEVKFKDSEYWFVKVDQADDALELLDNMDYGVCKKKTERCVVEVPCITLVVETGVGYYTTPLISIDTHLNAVVSDWSQNLSVSGSLTLSMNYYNQALAAWEPIIELNEHKNANGINEYLPWELNFGLEIESKKSEFDEDLEEKTTKIKIHAEENLEMTVSKTCLDILGVLSAAFSQAIDSEGLVKPEVIAPYVLENDTGFDVSINFTRGIFTLHECHMPKASTTNSLNRSLVFQAPDAGANFTPEQVTTCTISAGGRVYLQTKDLSTLTSEEDEEYNVYVKIGGIDKELILPVSKSDKRYFSLFRDKNQDPWGIVSEVQSEYGTTVVNLHGVINVFNHFSVSVSVYRNKPQSAEKIFVGEVAPRKTFHVPLHAIYSDTKTLYFAVQGYNVSVQGIQWSDSPSDLNYLRQIQCDPLQTYETLHMNVERQKTEIFHEHTNKYKLLSAFYTLHLRPPLYFCNALPISIRVSVAGCASQQKDQLKAEDTVDRKSDSSIIKEELLDYGEKEVNPGDVLHLPTFKFSGKGKEQHSYLVIRLIQYLEKDWSCTTEISDERERQLESWKFSSYDSEAKMDMELCVRYDKRYCSTKLTLYSPFWMINKTGLMLSYKADTETVDVLYHPPEYDGPILFAFREKFFFEKKSATIRVDNGEWSDKIPLDVAGSIGEVTCKSNDLLYQIGVHNHLTYNSFTKIITFIPFYIATNKCDFPIELQEQSRPGDPWLKVEPNACVPIWPKNDSNNMMMAKVNGHCTVPFKYSEVQCTLLKLVKNKHGGINVDVQNTEGGVYITFSEYKYGDAPGLLINHTTKPITFYEKGVSMQHVLEPHQQLLYTWADPAGEKAIVFGKNEAESDLRRDGVGELTLLDNSPAYWVSFLDGLQRVLLFTEIEAIATKSESSATLRSVTQSIELRLHGIGLSVFNNETGVDILYLGITSSGIIWEYKKEPKKRFKPMNIHDTAYVEAQYQMYLIDKSVNQVKQYYLDGKHEINFDKMVLTKSNKRTIQRTFYPGVWVCMNTSPFQTQLHAKINKIQIDNQLADCIFPVVLAPIAPPKTLATETVLKPFVECSIVERVVPNSTVKQYKYATMLIQEFHFKVDLLFLTAIANMFTSATTDEQSAKLFNDDCESIKRPLFALVETHSMQEQKNFYDNLHLGPLKIHVSFSMAGSDTTALPGILSTLVQGVGVTLTDVNDVVFRLAFFEREYQFFTQRQLISEITAHYTGQALKQLYVLVLGLDVLGNPYGLVVGFKKGVEDLFYEPFQGAIQGPGEFAEGLVLGVKSLFGHTVGGAAGAVSKITGAMGKGLAVLTFDDDYQKKRRQAMNRKPANFQEGIARSSKSLVMGFVDGVTGVVKKPVTGAKEEGVEGFFKGLGKGAIGLVARPTAGVVDFASGSFDAVKRATESHEDVKRLRPARFMHQDNVLRPYCLADAQGNKLLKEIEKGKYSNTDTFVHCEEIVQKSEYAIVSNHRIIYVNKNDLFGTWTVQWSYLWTEIITIRSSDRGVEMTLKKEGKKVMGLFSSNEVQRKVILIPQKARRDKLAEIMESQRADA